MKILAVFLLTMFHLSSVNAHHAFAAAFEADKRGKIVGEISEVFFKNPHIKYYVSVTGKNGKIDTWSAISSSPNSLPKGWNKKTFRVGDKVTIEGYLGRNNSHKIDIRSIENQDGTRFAMELSLIHI